MLSFSAVLRGEKPTPPSRLRRATSPSRGGIQKKGAPQRPFPSFHTDQSDQNAKTSVPLIVRGAPIWTKGTAP